MADRSKMAADASECVSLSQTAAGVQSNEQRQDSMSDRGRSKYTHTHTHNSSIKTLKYNSQRKLLRYLEQNEQLDEKEILNLSQSLLDKCKRDKMKICIAYYGFVLCQ